MLNSESNDKIECQSTGLIFFCQVVARRSKMIFWVTVGAFVMAVAVSLSLPNIYSAKAMVVPAQEDKGLMNAMMAQMGGLVNLAAGAIGGGSASDLYVGMLKSETIKDPIIDRFKLTEVYKNKNRDDTYMALEKRVSFAAGKKDGIISISAEDKDPKRAADIANAYVEELQKLTIRLSATGAGKNRAFLEDRLSRAKADLAKAEENFKSFQGKNKAINVTEQGKAAIEGIAQLRAQLAMQEVQLASLRPLYADSSQEVKYLASSTRNLRAQIAKLEGSGGSSAIPSVGSMPALGQEYARLMREFKIQENLVELLTKQYELSLISEAKDVSPVQVLQKARVPKKKSKPHRAFVVVMTTFTAFLFSLVAAFVVERFAGMPDEEKAECKKLKFYIPFMRN